MNDLSPQQLDVLRCAWSGLSVKGTAEQLRLSDKTVKNYRALIYEKFGVTTITAAIRRGVELGYLYPASHPASVLNALWAMYLTYGVRGHVQLAEGVKCWVQGVVQAYGDVSIEWKSATHCIIDGKYEYKGDPI